MFQEASAGVTGQTLSSGQAAVPCGVTPLPTADRNPQSHWGGFLMASPIPYHLSPHTQNHCITRGGFLSEVLRSSSELHSEVLRMLYVASSWFELH